MCKCLFTNNLHSLNYQWSSRQEKKMYNTKDNMATFSRGHYFQMLILDVTLQMDKVLISHSVFINLKDHWHVNNIGSATCNDEQTDHVLSSPHVNKMNWIVIVVLFVIMNDQSYYSYLPLGVMFHLLFRSYTHELGITSRRLGENGGCTKVKPFSFRKFMLYGCHVQ